MNYIIVIYCSVFDKEQIKQWVLKEFHTERLQWLN